MNNESFWGLLREQLNNLPKKDAKLFGCMIICIGLYIYTMPPLLLLDSNAAPYPYNLILKFAIPILLIILLFFIVLKIIISLFFNK